MPTLGWTRSSINIGSGASFGENKREGPSQIKVATSVLVRMLHMCNEGRTGRRSCPESEAWPIFPPRLRDNYGAWCD